MDVKLIITLCNVPKVGRKTIQNILNLAGADRVNTLEELAQFLDSEEKRISRFKSPIFSTLEVAHDKALSILKKSNEAGIKAIGFFDSLFPECLKHINDHPVILYTKGDVRLLNEKYKVAIIGTRKPTSFGSRSAVKIATRFAKNNFIVVSGLAVGCDTHGHVGCLNANGRTIAVLAHGLDTVFPDENNELAKTILSKKGCLVSEYPIGTRCQRYTFVDRDRLQSGLSDAVIVIETDIIGGTMHTVRFCIEQEKILACINHPAEHLSQSSTYGNQKLISDGIAKPLNDEKDIEALMEEISITIKNSKKILHHPVSKQLPLF